MSLDFKANIEEYILNFSLEENIDNKGEKPKTIVEEISINGEVFKRYINEFWTSKQRQGSSIHEISYRACFKPQLPGFFIKLFTDKGDIVYDPFSGRGTTVLEAGLLGRRVISNDINPLSNMMAYPRFFIPENEEVKKRLYDIPFTKNLKANMDLSMFYHPDTEAELMSLREYLKDRKQKCTEDHIDSWIRMIATNRLTGHSKGFFSVYTLPPNQAISPERQIKINKRRNQKPDYRDVRKLILKKSRSLIRNITSEERSNLLRAGKEGLFLTEDAANTSKIPDEVVKLTVTSPPFLDVVQYADDNWLRCWFNDIDPEKIAEKITMESTIEGWTEVMGKVFHELYRVTKKGGFVAFEVGEVRKGKIKLDEYVVPLGIAAGFDCKGIVINLQEFTKTSNIWGVKNNKGGTNTNRIVIFRKE